MLPERTHRSQSQYLACAAELEIERMSRTTELVTVPATALPTDVAIETATAAATFAATTTAKVVATGCASCLPAS